MTDDERGRGILTEADRAFLRNPDEYSRQNAHARQNAIGERVRNAILDFTVLFDNLDAEGYQRIFGRPPTPKSQRYADPALEAGLRDALAFVFHSSGAKGYFLGHADSSEHTTGLEAERLLTETFDRLAWRYRYQLNTAALNIDAEMINWHDLVEELEAGHELNPEQLAHFLSHDDVDTSEIQAQVRSMIDTDESG